MVVGLGSALVQLGHPVFVYGYGGRPSIGVSREDVSAKAISEGIVPRVFRPPRLDLPVPPQAPAWDRMSTWLSSNEDQLDLVVVHGAFGRFSMRMANACRRGRIPYVSCPHTPYSPELFETRGALKRTYWQLLERPFLQNAKAIHVLAPSHEKYLRNRGIDAPIFVVANGLERRFFESARRNPSGKHASARNAIRLLYLGRWDIYNKGLDLLFQGLAQARASGLRATLRIAGKASHRQQTALRQSIESLGLIDAVSLDGFMSDVSDAARDADFVVLPSRFDGFGQVVIEALALGTPVIVSSKAGAAEYFGPSQGVLVFDPDPLTIAEVLQLGSRERAEMRDAAMSARPLLERDFTWRVLAERWISEVDAVISNPHSQSD
jgi:glycosyltransferase involved in cell wall biosynthesis